MGAPFTEVLQLCENQKVSVRGIDTRKIEGQTDGHRETCRDREIGRGGETYRGNNKQETEREGERDREGEREKEREGGRQKAEGKKDKEQRAGAEEPESHIMRPISLLALSLLKLFDSNFRQIPHGPGNSNP